MEQENVEPITQREEACKKIKQIADIIRRLKINNYLKIGGLTEKDQQALSMLEHNMATIAEENGLQQLANEIKTTMSARYDIKNVDKYNINEQKDKSISDNQNKILEAYRGAVDAETQALRTGKISRAKKCQAQATQYISALDEDNKKIAIEYKRELFSELNISLNNTKENVEKWKSRYQGCLRPKDFSDRVKISQIIGQMTKGCEKIDGEKHAGSDDRSI